MKSPAKATQQQTKEHNRNLVLKNLFDHLSISRAEIARITGLTRTTVSDLVSELMDEGLVCEIGLGESIGGKSPILLSLVPDSRYVIGVDLARDRFMGTICNLSGEIIERVQLPVKDCDGELALDSLYQILDQLLRSNHKPVVGIGIGTPGLVNTELGLVVDAVNLDWKNLPLAKLLTERYHLPIFILNDSQAAAMGEFVYGKLQLITGNLVLINARHGIGSGIIVNGRLFQGDGGGAGEIGHITVIPREGLVCRCGNTGCLETVASTHAVVHQARHLRSQYPQSFLPEDPNSIHFQELLKAYQAGDELARRVVLESGMFMGLAVSSLVGTLNIENIILSGDMTCFGEGWLNTIRETIAKRTLPGLSGRTRVQMGTLGSDCIVLGAAALVLNDYSILFTHTKDLI